MLGLILSVGSGGALGSLIRLLMTSLVHRWLPTGNFPIGILLCNILGSLLIGLVVGYLFQRPDSLMWQRFLVIGFCGGFTTFSSFSLDTIELVKSGQVILAMSYVLTSVLLCCLATLYGLSIATSTS